MRALDWKMTTLTTAAFAAVIGRAILTVLGVLAAPLAAHAQDRAWEWGWGMHHPVGWMWGAWGIGMMVMMFAFWALVIAGIVLAVRWLARQGGGGRPDRALEILRERYARGEINREEFESRRRDLEH